MTTPLCIYHGNCADGFTAAWAVKQALGDGVEFFAGTYQSPPPDVRGRDVVMVDFSYKRPVIDAMGSIADTILILDHHKSAAEDLAGFPAPIPGLYNPNAMLAFQHENNAPAAIHALFDMERSGAGIAWDFFHPGRARPNLVNYVEDRDLWRFKLPFSREVNAFVFAHEYTFENWDHLDRMTQDVISLQNVADMGGAIEMKHHKDVAELVKGLRRRIVIGGHTVWAASLPYTLTSDAGHMMAGPGEPFAACYWDTPEGRVFSLRSRDDGANVADIAKQYGGGGHAHASGFRVPFSRIAEFELPATTGEQR